MDLLQLEHLLASSLDLELGFKVIGCFMNDSFRIGDLAASGGVPTSTIRFYERRGLLHPDARSRAGYRLYGQATMERLRFIRLAQSSGFTLENIAALLEFQTERSAPRDRVRAMLTTRLADVRRRQAELKRLEKVLKESLAACSCAGGSTSCPVIGTLTVSATGGGHKKNKKGLDSAPGFKPDNGS